MYRVFLSSRAEKNLKLLDKKARVNIRGAIDNLIHTYFPKKYDIRKLKGLQHTYRLRIGNERIIYSVDFRKRRIFILSIAKRDKVYKELGS